MIVAPNYAQGMGLCYPEPSCAASSLGTSKGGRMCAAPICQPVRTKNVLYKTELCRKFSLTGHCRYGPKCQFAHGPQELRSITKHPLYKTSKCKTFMQTGSCPYGNRCRFIHSESERAFVGLNRGVASVSPALLPVSSKAGHCMPAVPPPPGFDDPNPGSMSPMSVVDFASSASVLKQEAEIAALQAKLSKAQLLLRAQAQIQAQLEQLNRQMAPHLHRNTTSSTISAIERTTDRLRALTVQQPERQKPLPELLNDSGLLSTEQLHFKGGRAFDMSSLPHQQPQQDGMESHIPWDSKLYLPMCGGSEVVLRQRSNAIRLSLLR